MPAASLLHVQRQAADQGGVLDVRDIGDLCITDWRSPELEGSRAPLARGEDAGLLVLCTLSTQRQITGALQETGVRRPDAVLVACTRPAGNVDLRGTPTRRTVRVPLAALAPYDTGQGVPDFLRLDSLSNPLARLTRDFLWDVDDQLNQMSPAEIECARTTLLVLIAGMIRATHVCDVSERGFLPFLRRSLEDWIVSHLAAGAMSVGDLAAAHNVAPRTVHRAFAATGDTMGSVVRAHRLAAARSDLVQTTSSIAAIAHRWGFCDASHLGREFRREFSMSPGEYRSAHGIA